MFNKILIANRGEIACRVIKTAGKMGIETVAIYSTADEDSQHVKLADHAFQVGEATAKSSYLNIDAIIRIARDNGVQAIHPGYGFLAENPQFAKACAKAGITFIGPSIEAMEAMASKQLAKQLLEKTKVPLTPGYHGQEQSDDHLLTQAGRIGFPVLLKAAAGGGGKGMRAVHSEEDFLPALAGARREALASFADETMIIEKLVSNPRHVEVQIMADNFGEVVHLFERDCSIQRRHQKIIEEAPAPNLDRKLRHNLAEAACEVARSIEYRGAGTVEFLVADDQSFYFMEMNTRLQVEHPVTEMITGLDLVEWQIRIAANEALPCRQEEITQHGHAIECRVYAEDPHQGFMPSTGTLHFLREPAGEGLRIDSGVTCGSTITMYYDPMIAKLIAWGETRTEALQRLQHALKHYFIGGVRTNLPFLQAVCASQRFADAQLGTDFLQKESIIMPETNTSLALTMAAGYEYLTRQEQADPLARRTFAWQMHLDTSWHWNFVIQGQRHDLAMTPINEQQFTLAINGEPAQTIRAGFDRGLMSIDNGQQRLSAWIEVLPSCINCYIENGPVTMTRYNWEDVGQHAVTGKAQLTAPMPATVVAILKNKGDKVKEGERLIVLEAMKMEHTIHAPKNGVLTELYYEVGSQVQEGAELLALQD
ncbi:acetyl-CoA carboxylase biotin carboxylase subunit [Legionella spiritensis]|uniref:Biotin carboxylase n=1 Tax=Legionella spiritensis TaxID=452 RepID=A0A0W0YY19_LEGSP|nr:acetyl-CoA carboxylase biotin carboxylase subunit [Legionella spiritensis]KTD61414.1 acyl CoA carboxylase subunit alpha [Legionella spiritensis]SNV33424.1 acyl CoA carboxylase subunit alpha [Legionella spiritensis]